MENQAVLVSPMLVSLQQRLRAEGELMLMLKIRPGAAKTAIKSRLVDGTIKMDVAAVPEDGKANRELIEFLADSLGVAKAKIEILSGQTAKVKKVRITR